jgi:hypothetical protein
MATVEITANGKSYSAGKNKGEDCHYHGHLYAQTDSDGRMSHRATHYQAKVGHKILKETGSLPLYESAVASGGFNLLSAVPDLHPKASIQTDRRAGNRQVPVQKIELAGLQPSEWEMVWASDDNYKGTNFEETLIFQASRGTITDLATNASVSFDLEDLECRPQ